MDIDEGDAVTAVLILIVGGCLILRLANVIQ